MTSDSDSIRSVFSSFRDPDGFLFYSEGVLYRQINTSYRENYEHLKNSGLLEKLQSQNLLVRHQETEISGRPTDDAYRMIRPECIPVISYPYEWCFSQIRDAALLTLQIQKTAMDFGMSLKDASAYNIQFSKGKPIFIDTLSFEKSDHQQPWTAYRQFCQHFLAPLAVMHYLGSRLNPISKVFLDGIPLDIASAMLPARSYLNPSAALHIHLHSRMFQESSISPDSNRSSVNLNALRGIIESLEKSVKKLKPRKNKAVWADYYSKTHNYAADSAEAKTNLIRQHLTASEPKSVWDMGANTGRYSRIAAEYSDYVLSMDMDPDCVEINYQEAVKSENRKLLPLVFDVTNPSPGIGWRNHERTPLEQRSQPDLIMALALIHHLAIAGNLPLEYIAEYFYSCTGSWLIIEYVPKSDDQVKRLLSTRKDIFVNYSEENFKSAFGSYFTTSQCHPVGDSGRTLYLMKKITH